MADLARFSISKHMVCLRTFAPTKKQAFRTARRINRITGKSVMIKDRRASEGQWNLWAIDEDGVLLRLCRKR